MIENKTKNKIVCNNKKTLSTPFEKALGLMFSKQIDDIGYIFLFDYPRRIDLHMFFVFFSIDLLFLDADKKVIEIKENFKPFSLYYSRNKAKFLIELPYGKIKESQTRIGDRIIF